MIVVKYPHFFCKLKENKIAHEAGSSQATTLRRARLVYAPAEKVINNIGRVIKHVPLASCSALS